MEYRAILKSSLNSLCIHFSKADKALIKFEDIDDLRKQMKTEIPKWSNKDSGFIVNNYWTRLSKISWFVSGEQKNYLPKPKAEANNWSARHWQIMIFCSTLSNNCFIIRLPRLFSYFNHFLAAQGNDLLFFSRKRGSNCEWAEYYLQHSRSQRPRSFWPAPRIATFGQVQQRRSRRFTDFPSLCACSESSLTNLIGSGLNLLCLQIHSKPECRLVQSFYGKK